jgi:hypothetical protein
MDTYAGNGRVNITEPEDVNARFRMFERTTLANTVNEQNYRPVLGNGWESNVLSQVFFSAENLQIIQNGIRAGVFAMSDKKYVLPNQNVDSLQIIMRSVYSQHARHSATDITGQVAELNDLVLDYAVQDCYSASVAYEIYRRDQSSLVVPLDYARRPDRDNKQLELKPWF